MDPAEEPSEREVEPGMRRKRVTLPDGRYLLFYTFPGASLAPRAPDAAGAVTPAPSPGPTEERRV